MISNEESPLKFPCEFPIKVVGEHCDEFEIAVLTIVRKHIPELAENSITTRMSKKGKYLAITVTVLAQSKAQLDAIYQDLSAHELVMMAL